MIVQLGSFDERNEGFKKFKDFVVEAERRGLVNTVDQDLELQVYLPDEEVPESAGSDLAAEGPKEEATPTARSNGRADGRPRAARTAVSSEETESAEPTVREEATAAPGFDLVEDLTPYELKTICKSVANLREPASFVEIFGSIRDLDERGELELSQEEIREVLEAMLEAGYLAPTRAKPYEEAKANVTFYTLDRDRQEVRTALE
jgi:hypothetical protein